jgi:hypothetical protein
MRHDTHGSVVDILCALAGIAFRRNLHEQNANANTTPAGTGLRAPQGNAHQHAGDGEEHGNMAHKVCIEGG